MGNVAEIRSLLIIEQNLSNVYAYKCVRVFVFKHTTTNNNNKKNKTKQQEIVMIIVNERANVLNKKKREEEEKEENKINTYVVCQQAQRKIPR